MPSMPAFFSRTFFFTALLIMSGCLSVSAEPIVITGAMVPELLGASVASLRLVNSNGDPVPFQIDEVTSEGEYICPDGESPNAGDADGKLDRQDEIVFLWEDADSECASAESTDVETGRYLETDRSVPVTISRGDAKRRVWLIDDPLLPLSTKSYCDYDHAKEYLRTPYYYAQFCRNRFHFTKAGVMDFENGRYVDLTKELRVEIKMKILWGLIPIRYTENSMVCHVKRYKAGPIRLIRRGDFYLKLGFGIKASRAVVYQMCYPQIVKVPVSVTIPIRLKSFLSDAYIEMTPVIRKEVADKCFHFLIPGIGYFCDLSSGRATIDTLIRTMPDNGYVVSDGRQGYGWITHVEVDSSVLSGSGYIMRRPSKRHGELAECGLRLTVRDLPKGNYEVINWVIFSKHSLDSSSRDLGSILAPAAITTSAGTYINFLVGKK